MDSKNDTIFEKINFEQSPYITDNQSDLYESTESIDQPSYINYVIIPISITLIIIIIISILIYMTVIKNYSDSSSSSSSSFT